MSVKSLPPPIHPTIERYNKLRLELGECQMMIHIYKIEKKKCLDQMDAIRAENSGNSKELPPEATV